MSALHVVIDLPKNILSPNLSTQNCHCTLLTSLSDKLSKILGSVLSTLYIF